MAFDLDTCIYGKPHSVFCTVWLTKYIHGFLCDVLLHFHDSRRHRVVRVEIQVIPLFSRQKRRQHPWQDAPSPWKMHCSWAIKISFKFGKWGERHNFHYVIRVTLWRAHDKQASMWSASRFTVGTERPPSGWPCLNILWIQWIQRQRLDTRIASWDHTLFAKYHWSSYLD